MIIREEWIHRSDPWREPHTGGRGWRGAGDRGRATDKFLVKLECRGPPPRSYGGCNTSFFERRRRVPLPSRLRRSRRSDELPDGR